MNPLNIQTTFSGNQNQIMKQVISNEFSIEIDFGNDTVKILAKGELITRRASEFTLQQYEMLLQFVALQ